MRRRHRRLHKLAELDITAFMNLMIVLVPVLLINMVFAQTAVLDLNFPKSLSSGDNKESFQLQLFVLPNQLVVADNKGGVLKRIPQQEGEHDYPLLALVMKDIKARVPDKKDITILPVNDTSYQTLVTVMDTVRSYRTAFAGSVVQAELFPDISISDAPDVLPEGGSS